MRLRAGLAQAAFGEALGYSRRAVINWEQDAAEPSIGVLAKLRHVLTALFEALRSPGEPPAQWPQPSRGQILLAVRMAGPIAPMPMTPLPDEDST